MANADDISITVHVVPVEDECEDCPEAGDCFQDELDEAVANFGRAVDHAILTGEWVDPDVEAEAESIRADALEDLAIDAANEANDYRALKDFWMRMHQVESNRRRNAEVDGLHAAGILANDYRNSAGRLSRNLNETTAALHQVSGQADNWAGRAHQAEAELERALAEVDRYKRQYEGTSNVLAGVRERLGVPEGADIYEAAKAMKEANEYLVAGRLLDAEAIKDLQSVVADTEEDLDDANAKARFWQREAQALADEHKEDTMDQIHSLALDLDAAYDVVKWTAHVQDVVDDDGCALITDNGTGLVVE
jgi:hypothetical protein